jgi:hypothetical protein
VAHCDCCGTYFYGGSIERGKYRFCNGVCAEKGAVLAVLDCFSPEEIDRHIASAHAGPCPLCGAHANVDVHQSHRVYSIIVYISWRTKMHFCCQKCGRKEQLKDLGFCMACGWWGVPGLVITPVQILKNIIGIMRVSDRPSRDLQRIVKLNLAESLARQARART